MFSGRNFEKHFNAPYTNNPDLLYADLSEIYEKTIQKLYNLGCRSIQIDEPTWFAYPSLFVSGKEAELEYSKKYVDCVLKVFLPIFSKKPSDLSLTIHFCRGNSFSTWDVVPAYDTPFIVDAVKQLNFHGLLMEYDTTRCGSFEALEKLNSAAHPQTRFYIGTVSTKTTVLETEEYVEGRIRSAAEYVPLEKLGLTTQCGFCTGIALPQDTSEQSQWEKLELIIKVAKKIWGSA